MIVLGVIVRPLAEHFPRPEGQFVLWNPHSNVTLLPSADKGVRVMPEWLVVLLALMLVLGADFGWASYEVWRRDH